MNDSFYIDDNHPSARDAEMTTELINEWNNEKWGAQKEIINTNFGGACPRTSSSTYGVQFFCLENVILGKASGREASGFDLSEASPPDSDETNRLETHRRYCKLGFDYTPEV